MTHYQSSNPRAVFAIGAFALTAITIGLAVVVPAKMESGDRIVRALAVSNAERAGGGEAVTERVCIVVVGVRDPSAHLGAVLQALERSGSRTASTQRFFVQSRAPQAGDARRAGPHTVFRPFVFVAARPVKRTRVASEPGNIRGDIVGLTARILLSSCR
jgi:hypothetical protein